MTVQLDPQLLRQFGQALEEPRPGYHAALGALADALTAVRLEAARMVRGFADRVAELEQAEVEELHSQTFDRALLRGDRPSDVLRRLSYVDAEVQPEFVERVVVPTFDRVLEVLEPERNPFALLVKAAYCLVLPAASDRLVCSR